MAKINLFLISIVLTNLSHFLSFFFFYFYSISHSQSLSPFLLLCVCESWLSMEKNSYRKFNVLQYISKSCSYKLTLTVHLADFSKEVILYRGGSKPSSLFLLKNNSVYKWMIYQNGKWVAYHSNEEAEFWLSK